jgi:raffinose/stachyose/melibiose transport system permease protein
VKRLLLFPLPALILYGAFFVLPAAQGLRYAVTDWDGYSPSFAEVGAGNFRRIATADDLFAHALTNNLKFLLAVLLGQTVLSLLLAVLLPPRGLRGVYFLPTILSSVSVAFVWRFIYDPATGPLAGTRMTFLGDEKNAIYFVAITQVWFHAGQMMILFLAGIEQIPAELYEAARTDGATGWQQFRHITWPLLTPATALVVAYTTIQSFKAFDLILGLGGNPPRSSLDILSTRIYTTFANGELGYAAAESVVFMVVIAVVTVLQRRAGRLS